MAATPQSRPALTKAPGAGTHPVAPLAAVPDNAQGQEPVPTPPPPATDVQPIARKKRVHKIPATWRIPEEILDRLDDYVIRRGIGKEASVAEAIDEYLKKRGA